MLQTLNHQDEAAQGGETSLNQLDSFERCLEGWNRLADHRGPRSEGAVVTLSSGTLLQLDCDGVSIGSEYFQERRHIVRELERAKAEVARLESKLEMHVASERAMVAEELRRLAQQFGLSAMDVFPAPAPRLRPAADRQQEALVGDVASTVAPNKYGNSQGQVWSGRGRYPRWLKDALQAGRSLAEFAL